MAVIISPTPERVPFRIRHVTTYRYATPVKLFEHRVMFRPREAHDIDVIDATVAVNLDADVRWVHDVHSNSVALVTPKVDATELRFDCAITLNHRGSANLELPLEDRALKLPVAYNAEERQVLVPWLAAVDEDPHAEVAGWAKGFCAGIDDTRAVLEAMSTEIRGFTYQARDAEGTQTALDTLRSRSGTCRDYAWLMIEALRSLGIACRFVSGYLYDPTLDVGATGGGPRVGAGATHAWLNVYLPGAGWVPYDPTNLLTGGHDLIRVGYARRPQDAVPLSGSWFGSPDAYLGMTVEVSVERM